MSSTRSLTGPVIDPAIDPETAAPASPPGPPAPARTNGHRVRPVTLEALEGTDRPVQLPSPPVPDAGSGPVPSPGPSVLSPPEHAESAAADLADRPRLWRTLLFAHQPDRTGRCLACVGVRWPCGPRRLAERAQQIHDGR